MDKLEALEEQLSRLLILTSKMQDKIYDLDVRLSSVEYDIKHHCKGDELHAILRD